jgi:hypothetical protein
MLVYRGIINGAEGGTRTPMGCPTRPSNVRVYQFHHFGTCEKLPNGINRARENHFRIFCSVTSGRSAANGYFFITGCFAET